MSDGHNAKIAAPCLTVSKDSEQSVWFSLHTKTGNNLHCSAEHNSGHHPKVLVVPLGDGDLIKHWKGGYGD